MSDQYENSGTPAVRQGIRRVTPDAFQLVRAGEAMTDLKLAVSDQWDKKNMNVHAWQAIAEAVGELEQALERLGEGS